jgi:type II secretory pathway predicted ATPase ExeA
MSHSHFGLDRRPFPATPDDACYYPAEGHERALTRLLAGLADGEGVLALVGGPGTGKTLLCHRLLEHLADQAECVCLTHTHLRDRAGLLQAVLFDLGLPHAGRTEQEMRLTLTEHLLQRYSGGQRTVLVVDEAQHLGVDLLEELRMLGNLEGRSGKALQVVLVGQPELLEVLSAPALASLRQRLAVRALLQPLGVQEAADYLLHHLRVAGALPAQVFTDEALEMLAHATHGVPRLLNQSAHRAMQLAEEAGAGAVDAEAAMEALAGLGLSSEAPPPAEQADPPADAGGEAADLACRLFVAPVRSA